MRHILIPILFLLLTDISFAQAIWRGRTYNAPVCSNGNCQMCNSIRSQLYTPPKPTIFLSEVQGGGSKVKALDKVTDLVPTPETMVPNVLSLLNLSSSDIFIEPGCGDGRILDKASKVCISIGIELNKESASKARANAPDAIVMEGDAATFDYSKVTAVSIYLYPALMEKIIPLLPTNTRIVSYQHTCNGIQWKEHTIDGHKFYTGVK